MEHLTIALLFGGQSNEYSISLKSAVTIYHGLKEGGHDVLPIGISPTGDWYLFWGDPSFILEDRWHSSPQCQKITLAPHGTFLTEDGQIYTPHLAFPAMHGQGCEDGKLQGFLDTWGIPYVGCGVEASVLSMNKILTKEVALGEGIPVLPYIKVTKETPFTEITTAIPFPCFVKPVHSGSSIGAGVARNKKELEKALALAFSTDDTLLVEPYTPSRELEVAVLQTDTLLVSRVGELKVSAPFYDFDTKYITQGATPLIPAPIPDSVTQLARDYAARLFLALGCRHLARVDFFYHKGNLYLNEINTLPGFTAISMYPSLMLDAGIPLADLLTRLCRAAL